LAAFFFLILGFFAGSDGSATAALRFLAGALALGLLPLPLGALAPGSSPFGGLVDFKIVLRDTNMFMHFLGGQTIFVFQCSVWTELSLIYQGLDFFSFVSSIKARDVLQVGKM
jgi:hypothetical protein